VTIEEQLVTLLDAAASALGATIYALEAPQDVARPYIIYSVLDSNPIEENADPAKEINETEITIESHADTYPAAKTLANAARTVVIGGFEAAVIETTRDDREGDTRHFSVFQNYRIWHEGSFP
jgi:hypothetical protein